MRTLHYLTAGLRSAFSNMANRIAIPSLVAGAALALPQPSAGQSGTWSATGSLGQKRSNHTETLLPNGKVLIVAGSENDARNNSRGAESYRAAVWDPKGTNESSISVQNLAYDVFCSGTAALVDGRSLIVGGTSD